MNQFDFMAICAYYYITEFLRLAAFTAAGLALLFMIYKLVGWALWVMSL